MERIRNEWGRKNSSSQKEINFFFSKKSEKFYSPVTPTICYRQLILTHAKLDNKPSKSISSRRKGLELRRSGSVADL